MAQTKNPRRVAPTEARAKLVNVRISPQKLNLVAQSIRGMPVQKALNELEFSRKRIATEIQQRAYEQVMFVPLGGYSEFKAYDAKFKDMVAAPLPLFWRGN